jgi:hypothetical protein
MIDYKYPTITSGATPIGSAGRAPDEKLLREGQFRVHGLNITPIGRTDFKKSNIKEIEA